MFKYFLTLFLAAQLSVHSQDVLPSVDYNFERGYRFQQALQSQNELVVIYGRSDWFFYSSRLTVRFHNADGSIAREKKLILTANSQPAYLIHAFVNDNDLYFVCAVPFTSKSDMGWCILKYNNGIPTKSLEVVQANALPRSWLLNGQMTTTISADSSRMAICMFSPNNPETAKKMNALSFSVNNPSNYNIIQATLPYTPSRYEVIEPLVDINGSLFLIGKYYGFKKTEISNNLPNYTYMIHRGDGNIIEEIGEIPQRNSIVRSIGGLVMNNIFFGSGLTSDTSLASNDSVYTVRIPLSSPGDAVVNVTPLKEPPAIGNAFQNRFSNKSLWINNRMITQFELNHIEYNESAKQGKGFTYERGSTIVTSTSVQGKLDNVNNILKWQTFNEIPTKSLQLFYYKRNIFASYVEYRDDEKRTSDLHFINLKTNADKTFNVSNIDWEKDSQYYMFEIGNRLITLQSKSRNYSLFIAPLP